MTSRTRERKRKLRAHIRAGRGYADVRARKAAEAAAERRAAKHAAADASRARRHGVPERAR